ncbi:MAG: patatin-like phospholipase family protein [bacterium]|nr:patatin-like phospholipase family protein [bacterium]
MRIAVALGGGGAKGFAHVGILEALKNEGIKIDIITGTSMGALVGAAYAAGKLERFRLEAEKIRLQDIPRLLSPSWSWSGMFSGQNVIELLSSFIGVEKIEDLPITYAAIATNLTTGNAEALVKGSLTQAIRASISVPALFTPVMIEGRAYIDGGASEPLPISAARALGADVVVGIDLFGNALPCPPGNNPPGSSRPSPVQSALSYLESLPEKFRPRLGNKDTTSRSSSGHVFEILEKTLVINQKHLTRLRLKEDPADILISPAVANVSILDFHRFRDVVRAGEDSGKITIQALRERGF